MMVNQKDTFMNNFQDTQIEKNKELCYTKNIVEGDRDEKIKS